MALHVGFPGHCDEAAEGGVGAVAWKTDMQSRAAPSARRGFVITGKAPRLLGNTFSFKQFFIKSNIEIAFNPHYSNFFFYEFF
jgi:hypothetical protein